MRSTQAWHEVTAKPITPKVMDWLNDLSERFGDERVAAKVLEVAGTGKLDNLIGRVRDALAKEAALHRSRPAPIEVGREQLLRIVRGEEERPEGAFTWDTWDLTSDEYGEVLAWSSRRKGLALDAQVVAS
jgi:hypothetical protein